MTGDPDPYWLLNMFMPWRQPTDTHTIEPVPRKLDHIARARRIIDLYEMAAEDGNTLNEASARDALALLEILPPDEQPYIFGLDNGNVRIMWEEAGRWRASLEFKGGGQIALVTDRP